MRIEHAGSERLLADYAVPAGAGLVDLQVEMLELGAISVHGATVVELTQETFQCFFRCLGDTVLRTCPRSYEGS